LTLNLGEGSDVASTKGMCFASEGKENDKPYEKGEGRLEAGHFESFVFADCNSRRASFQCLSS
jgi:hypothetical protein